MTSTVFDYSLTGEHKDAVLDSGLVNAEWFLADVDPARMREFQQRTNIRAAIDNGLWVALIVGLGVVAVLTAWSWWSIPILFVYGALYGGAADSRWHECGHGTAFRSRWANEALYYAASFMLFRGPTVWRWSHYRHHTDTIIRGRDAEIVFQRPPNVARTVFVYTHLQGGSQMFWRLVKHAFGRIDDDAKEFVPESEWRKVIWESRVFVTIVLAAAVVSVVLLDPLPIVLIGAPTIYGAWLVVFFGITQHAGMRENVLDHRYNSRTVYMNPVFRWLYLNMNYHVEHHMFPSVPYRALPALHAEVKDQLAPALPNTLAAYRQIFSTLKKQAVDPIEVGEANWVRHSDGAIDLADAAVFEAGEMRRVDIDDRTFVLACLGEGEFSLCDGICTHQQVHLADGALVDGQIECPKHNARFDARTGAPTHRPAKEPIGVYDVEVHDGRLVTRLEPDASGPSESS
jgi:fatty acid desaturase/nitrite reductase/ring-hydroxylating ferredoxin subunit